jgi:hypothetical protein
MQHEQISAHEAALALAKVQAQQDRLFAGPPLPFWFWPATGLSCVVLSVAVESHQPLITAIGAGIFAVAILTIVIGAVRGERVRVRPQLMGVRGGLSIAGFVLANVALGLAVGFGLQAAGFGYPATAANAVVAVSLTVFGPLLMRRLQRIMREAAQAER